MAGLSSVLKSDWQAFCNGNRLNIVLSLASLTSSHPEAAKYSIEITSTVLADKNESVFEEPENFSECVDLLLSFSSAAAGYYSSNSAQINGVADGVDAASPKVRRKALPNQESVERAISALEMLFKLHFIIPKLIKRTEIRSERAWFEYWLPILSGLGQQCYHPSREIRQNAVTHLQRALLLPELEETTLDCSVDCFDNVLFALLDELLKNEVCKLDPHGMDETRMRACGLLCKIFLHYFDRLTKTKEVTRIWCRILDFLTKYSNCGGPILVNYI